MPISRRKFLKTGAVAAAGLTAPLWLSRAEGAALTDGPFAPSWESLAKYECPEWFRDAKFGIWAHWTAQCVPEMGDWYARQMYTQGSGDYNYQCDHYGHPSKIGFKDIDHLWHAENWDPERLMGLYKAAGAKYFMAMGQHHDNFDMWDSKYQPWNSVAIGPKKNMVATWAKVARAHGMRFGVSSHGSHTWSWYEVSQGADATGPLAGVPYDGHLTKADGKGLWWEGLDPQDLYEQRHRPMGLEWDWNNNGKGDLPSPAYCTKFYNRIVDLLDKYHPDLLYFDDDILPLYQVDPTVGLRIAAHHYNSSAKRNGGHPAAVLTGKNLSDAQQGCMTQDYERGQSDVIRPHPWQTDTCIGNWHYDRAVYEKHTYKTPDQVIKTLLDIVSKNGNLMLNIPLRGDGTIDSDELAFLHGMAAWMAVNEEAIFSTRPWKIYGEGPVRVAGGGFSEGARPYTAKDFRFTTKGNVLYATALGWPDDGKLTVRTLASTNSGVIGTVKTVQLLGHGDVPFSRTADGLVVTLPAQRPCDHAYALKITGLDLTASQPVAPLPPPLLAAADGSYTLTPDAADLHGKVQAQGGATPNIGYWDNPQDAASWTVHFDSPGTYAVSAKVSAANGDTAFVVDAGAGASAPTPVPKTTSWDVYQIVTGGTVKVSKAGDQVVTVRPADPATWKPMNLASLTLTKTP